MPVDTFMAYSAVYPNVEAALADYDAVHALHSEVGLIDAYDAAVVERKDDGKVKIVEKHGTPTRVRRRCWRWRGFGHRAGHCIVTCRSYRWGTSPRKLEVAVRYWVPWRAMPLPG